MNHDEIEIEHEVRFSKLSFATSIHDVPKAPPAFKTLAARTNLIGEIRVRRFRDRKLTVLKALVRVRVPKEDIHDLDAEVSVRLAVKGDLLAASPAEQEQFGERLQEIAQRHCLEFVGREIGKRKTIPLF